MQGRGAQTRSAEAQIREEAHRVLSEGGSQGPRVWLPEKEEKWKLQRASSSRIHLPAAQSGSLDDSFS